MVVKRCGFLLGAVLMGVITLGVGQESGSMGSTSTAATSAKLSMADQKFVKEAAQGGMAEVELGRLAVEKGSSDEVKRFGQKMVDDHGKANDRLKELAASKGLKLPQTASPKQKATKDRLSKLSGEPFDKAYMTDMLQDHKKDVSAFQAESNTGHDIDVKNFATQTLPTLRDHLKDAQTIAPKAIQAKGAMEPNSTRR